MVSYKGNPAALVTYETQEEKLSPLVPLSKSAMIAGGDEVQFGELPLHCHTASGLRVITWRNHGRLSRPLSNLSHNYLSQPTLLAGFPALLIHVPMLCNFPRFLPNKLCPPCLVLSRREGEMSVTRHHVGLLRPTH